MSAQVPWFQHRPVAVPQHCEGWTTGAFLVARFADWDADAIRAGLEAGLVIHADGRLASEASTVRGGEVLDVQIPGLAPIDPPPPLPPILHEDERLVVLDKPSDLPMHPAGSRFQYALVGLARMAWPDAAIDLAHRLDRDTSGVVVVTKDKGANAFLKACFREGRAHKRYVARVRGRPAWSETVLRHPIGRADGPIRIQMACRPDGLAATTRVRVLARDGVRPESLVALEPVTGRTHQLRVHLARAGHPILGDVLYGTDAETFLAIRGRGRGRETDQRTHAPRLLLHARRLQIPHPDGGMLDVSSPLPMEMVDRREDTLQGAHPRIRPTTCFDET